MIRHCLRIAAAAVLAGALGCESRAAAEGDPTPRSAVSGVTQPRDAYPDISPDGKKVVFQSNRTGTWQLWVANVDGTGLLRLTRTDANDSTPVWSPDGTRIMFASDRLDGLPRNLSPSESSGARDVFVMEVTGGLADAERTARRLVDNPADEMHPEWADGGRSIVLNRIYETGDGSDIVVLDANSGIEEIVNTGRGWNTYASTTPDGRRIAWRQIFEETRNGETVRNSDIVIAMRDGSDRARLTSSPAFDGWPAISPDGKQIAFASNRGEDALFHIYLMAMDGTGVRRLTGGAYNHTQPAWSADGRALAAFRWLADDAGEIGHIVMLEVPPRPQ